MREDGTAHPTRLQIIDVTAEILKSKGLDRLHIDDVLEATGLTRGALYHHFDNVDDLVESALIATYSEGVNINIGYVRDLLATATTFAEFRDGVLRANVLYSQNNRLRDVRRLRAHAMAVAEAGSRMALALADEQQRLTDEYVAVITEAQAKGWLRKDIEPLALAVFIQAYSFGAIVDDVSHDHLDADSWARIIASFFESCVFDT